MLHASEAIRREPKRPDGYLLRGHLYQQQEQHEGTIQDFANALELAPGCETALLGRTASLLRVGRLDLALADCDSALRVNANAVAAYLCRTQFYRTRTGSAAPSGLHSGLPRRVSGFRFSPARRHPARASSGSPPGGAGSSRCAAGATATCSVHGPWAPATRPVALERRPASGAARRYDKLSREQITRNNFDEALRILNQSIALDPKRAASYNARGYAFLRLRKFAATAADFSEAIRLRPDYANAYHNRAVTRRLLGDREGAAEDHRKARKAHSGLGSRSAKLDSARSD